MAKGIRSRMSPSISAYRKCDANDNNGQSYGLDQYSRWRRFLINRTGESCANSVHMGKPSVQEDADQHCPDADGVEDKEQLPCAQDEIWMVHGYGAGQKTRKAKIDAGSRISMSDRGKKQQRYLNVMVQFPMSHTHPVMKAATVLYIGETWNAQYEGPPEVG